jgi:hypothetical protein
VAVVFAIFVSDETFTRWGGLTHTTVFLYGFLIYDSRPVLGSRQLWTIISALSALHLVVFVIVLTHVHEWRFPGFGVMLLEVPIFNHLKNRL